MAPALYQGYFQINKNIHFPVMPKCVVLSNRDQDNSDAHNAVKHVEPLFHP